MAVALLAATLPIAQPLRSTLIVVDDDCSLVDAVLAANGDTPVGGCIAGDGEDEIRLTRDVLLTEPFSESESKGPTGLPDISSSITIEGSGFAIERDSGAEPFRILFVDETGDLAIQNTTVTGGEAGPGNDGGGIRNLGDLILFNTTLSDNVGDNGGGLSNYETLSVVDSHILRNSALSGGGIHSAAFSDFEISGTTIADNVADSVGGGIFAFGTVNALVITNSTLSGNTSDGDGSAIRHTPNYSGSLYINYSTIVAPDGGTAIYTYDGHIAIEKTILSCGGDCCGDIPFTSAPYENIRDNLISDNTCFLSTPPTGLDAELTDNGGPAPTHALLPDSNAIDLGSPCVATVDQRGFARRDRACDIGAFEFEAVPGPTVTATGSCPGDVSMTILEASSAGQVAIAIADQRGESVIPAGQPCEGTSLNLDSPSLQELVTADEAGTYSATLALSADSCRQFLQAIDLDTCFVSNVTWTPTEDKTGVVVVEHDCSLEDAMRSVNESRAVGGCKAGGPGLDEIQLTADLVLLDKELPRIESDVAFLGDGAIVRRGRPSSSFRIFESRLLGGADRLLVFENMTISGGHEPTDEGGGIETNSTLVLIDTDVENNTAQRGGGISASGATILLDSTVRSNSARSGDGGYGGGISLNNEQGNGSLLLINSTVSDNFAIGDNSPGEGGGIVNCGNGCDGDGGPVTLINSSVYNNHAIGDDSFGDDSRGGGMRQATSHPLTLINSTVSGNQGGLAAIYGGSVIEISHSAVVGNEEGGVRTGGTVHFIGSLMSNDSVLNCAGGGTFVDDGGNFTDDIGDCPGELLTGLDLVLADNGGPTLTHALLPGSSAIDARPDCSLIPDQRGFVRDAHCDAGPIEFAAVAPPPLEIAVQGACPGIVQATLNGATPNGPVSFVLSDGDDFSTLVTQPCPGTYLSIGSPEALRNATTDVEGTATVEVALSAAQCAASIQAVDRSTCATSGIVLVP